MQLVRDLLQDYSGEVIRMALLSAQYRQPIEWSQKTLKSAKFKFDDENTLGINKNIAKGLVTPPVR